MKPTTQQHPLEARMTTIRTGFRGIEEKAMSFAFAEGKLLPEEVTLRLQRGIDAFARERQVAAELKLALAERKRLMPSLSAFCDEAIAVAKRHYGGDAERMASFGVERHATAKAKPRAAKAAVVGAKVKAQARRIDPACGGANVIEEVVTTVVEAVVEEVVVNDEPRVHPCAPPSRRRAKGRGRQR